MSWSERSHHGHRDHGRKILREKKLQRFWCHRGVPGLGSMTIQVFCRLTLGSCLCGGVGTRYVCVCVLLVLREAPKRKSCATQNAPPLVYECRSSANYLRALAVLAVAPVCPGSSVRLHLLGVLFCGSRSLASKNKHSGEQGGGGLQGGGRRATTGCTRGVLLSPSTC